MTTEERIQFLQKQVGKKLKFAGLMRVSTEDQELLNQELKIIEYCERNGYEYELFREKISTRKTRPVKQDLLRRLLQKEFDGVIVNDLSRWGRTLSEVVNDIQTYVADYTLIYSKNDAVQSVNGSHVLI